MCTVFVYYLLKKIVFKFLQSRIRKFVTKPNEEKKIVNIHNNTNKTANNKTLYQNQQGSKHSKITV
jgi:hypothetical protein